MLLYNPQEIIKGRFRADIRLRVLKDADQTDIIVVIGQIRLHILKIAHMDRHIVRVHMAVGVNHAPLFGQLHTGYFPGPP